MRILKSHRSNIVATAVLGLSAIWYFKETVLRPVPLLGAVRDFIFYYQAGQAILHFRSPFADPRWLYPPVVAFIVAPFALTDYVTSRWIWFLLSHAFLAAAGWLVWRAEGRDRIAMCCVACVWAFGAAGENLEGGQMGPLLLLLLAIAYTQTPARQGVAIGTSFALKYFPGVLAIVLFLERSWRALTAFVFIALRAVVIPWGVLQLWFAAANAHVTHRFWMGTPHTLNWSLPSVVLRILDPPKSGGPLPYNWDNGNVVVLLRLTRTEELMSVGTAVVVFVAGVIVLTLACGGRLKREQAPWAMAGLISLSLAAAPVCWTHYQILQYPGLALLLTNSIRRRAWRFATCIVACGALLNPVPVAVLTAYYKSHGGFTAAAPATLYIWTSVTPLACLGVFGLALWNMRIEKAQPSPAMDRQLRALSHKSSSGVPLEE